LVADELFASGRVLSFREAVEVVLANLAADLLYSRLDPRIGRAGGATGT